MVHLNSGNLFKGCLITLACLIFTGCASTQLTMTSELPPLDNSVFSPKISEINCSKVMIIPPSGTARGTFEPKMVLFEREFLRQGMSIISPAITGRVVVDTPKGGDEADVTASTLSDMERALVMAKNTGADAILQVGMYEWGSIANTRFFVSKKEAKYFFEEVSEAKIRKWKGPNVKFPSPRLMFVGKIVDVENGEVLATLDIEMPANFRLPEDYVAQYQVSTQGAYLKANTEVNFKYYGYNYNSITMKNDTFYPWFEESKERTEDSLISYIAEKIRKAVQ